MIPAIIPPLTRLTVLVTRPAPQAETLAGRIRQLGGAAHVLPAIDIRPVSAAPVAPRYQLAIFVSVNAVEHGASLIQKTPDLRIAAIGKATANALAARDLPADIVPERGFDSESLLSHPDLILPPGAAILIVRGSGGRDLMRETFIARGYSVDLLDVYERVLPALDATRRQAIETLWNDGDIDLVTVTSVATLHNLSALLTDRGRQCLEATALVVASRRIGEAAAAMGLRGERIVAAAADDDSMLGAMAAWHTRARIA